MSTYFDRVEEAIAEAVERRARRPWYVRMLSMTRTRTIAVLVAALVIATPAVGAASGWFSFGKPNVPPLARPGVMYGLETPGSSRLLPLRVADPDGGPPWGMRIVKTSRDDTCVQFGRVEDGQLGSLGIDDAWNNDHQFHAISVKDSPDDQCGSTDAAGYGYVNRSLVGTQASANIFHKGQGNSPASNGCRLPQYMSFRRPPHAPAPMNSGSTAPSCPADAGRAIFFGLLGPDAVSVTYRKPRGRLATERTTGGVGAYMLVFRYTAATCYEYDHSPTRSVSCDSESMGGVSPSVPGAITKITYTDGHSCTLAPSAKLVAAYTAFQHQLTAKLGKPHPVSIQVGRPLPKSYARWLAAYKRMVLRFLTREHLTQTQFERDFGPGRTCPAVGWVAQSGPKVEQADVATPIVVKKYPTGSYGCPNKLKMPEGCNGIDPESPTPVVPIEWSFKARRAVTNSRSWYEWWLSGAGHGANCGDSSFATYTNIKQGQTLHYSTFIPTYCRGIDHIIVGFTPSAPPSATDNGNTGYGMPGHDGSLVVGRATFKIP